MAIGNEELMQKCFPEHSRMGIAKNEIRQNNREEGKKREASMERSKAGTKEKSRRPKLS